MQIVERLILRLIVFLKDKTKKSNRDQGLFHFDITLSLPSLAERSLRITLFRSLQRDDTISLPRNFELSSRRSLWSDGLAAKIAES